MYKMGGGAEGGVPFPHEKLTFKSRTFSLVQDVNKILRTTFCSDVPNAPNITNMSNHQSTHKSLLELMKKIKAYGSKVL